MKIPIVCLISLGISLLVSWLVYPKILLISLHKNIVDAPNARKLQKMPVPILGGFVVYTGILASLLCVSSLIDVGSLFTVLCIITLMLLLGLADDLVSLSAKGRFLIEVLVIVILVISDDTYIINNLYGLWGIGTIPWFLSIPLTIITGVGIINAINLIDGIDGLSSGYCIFSFLLFAILFYLSDSVFNLYLAIAAIGGLIPFFMHNVFGKYSKMFIGDAGTLMLGSLMAYFVISALHGNCMTYSFDGNFNVIPLLLAILSVPVFDTLRVMMSRIVKGQSPFNPDKTHLHHMFIRLGYSHIGATIAILIINAIVILSWIVSYKLGCPVDVQLYIVITFNVVFVVLLYLYVDRALSDKDIEECNSCLIKSLRFIGKLFFVNRGPLLKSMGRLLDKCVSKSDRAVLFGEK